MANSVLVQLLVDGPRNAVIKVTGVLDTSDVPYTIIIDPALLAGIDNTGTIKAKHLRMLKLTYNIEDLLSVNLFWDATVPLVIEELVGRGQMKYYPYGGLTDNSGAGSTGKIGLSTKGWLVGSVPNPMVFTLMIELGKVQT
jgi:hypothetical protein